MESQYSQLCELMDEALGALTALEGLLDEDFRYIKELRMTELHESNKRKEGLEACIRRVEERWTDVSNGLGRALGLPRGDRTLGEVVKRVSPPWCEALIERYERLSEAIKTLREKGQANIDLLNHSLLRIDESLKVINYFMNPGAIYSSGGKLDPPGGSGSFLSSQA